MDWWSYLDSQAAGTLATIVGVNVMLSADNGIVIALACRGLPPAYRVRAMIGGAALAVALRMLLTGFVAGLLALPLMRLLGGAALLHIATKLMIPNGDDEEGAGGDDGNGALWGAVRTIFVADLVMSADNVLAVAAVADGHLGLMAFGLLVSAPLIVLGSTVLIRLISRFPILVAAGAAMLGFVAAEMAVSDSLVAPLLADPDFAFLGHGLPALGAAGVVAVGWRLRTNRAPKTVDIETANA
ncbi:MAG: YjbE family putative metal transport protein [Magnetospirillum sp. WYHS-4]